MGTVLLRAFASRLMAELTHRQYITQLTIKYHHPIDSPTSSFFISYILNIFCLKVELYIYISFRNDTKATKQLDRISLLVICVCVYVQGCVQPWNTFSSLFFSFCCSCRRFVDQRWMQISYRRSLWRPILNRQTRVLCLTMSMYPICGKPSATMMLNGIIQSIH